MSDAPIRLKQAAERELRKAIRLVDDFPKPGIQFLDLLPVFAHRPRLLASMVEALVPLSKGAGKVAIVGIDARGFLLAAPLAMRLDAPLVALRKAGKTPPPVHRHSYALEYGEATLELGEGLLKPGQRVIIIDDILATGGTLAAAVQLVKQAGASVHAISCLAEVPGLGGRKRLAPHAVHTLLSDD